MSAAKSKDKRAPAIKPDPNVVQIVGKPGDDRATLLAQTYLRPTVQNGATVRAFNAGKDGIGPELMALIEELGEQVAAVNDGDLKRAEGMLIAQAHTLDAIFGSLARRAVNQDYLKQYETYMRLALKAQSQCRATLQALAEIKNPRPVAFVQQANISNGPQQVNNGCTSQPATACARESKSVQNKLLEHEHGERVDGTTTSAAGIADSRVEAMAAIDRAADGTRQGAS
jgi:hypothetical protein